MRNPRRHDKGLALSFDIHQSETNAMGQEENEKVAAAKKGIAHFGRKHRRFASVRLAWMVAIRPCFGPGGENGSRRGLGSQE